MYDKINLLKGGITMIILNRNHNHFEVLHNFELLQNNDQNEDYQ